MILSFSTSPGLGTPSILSSLLAFTFLTVSSAAVSSWAVWTVIVLLSPALLLVTGLAPGWGDPTGVRAVVTDDSEPGLAMVLYLSLMLMLGSGVSVLLTVLSYFIWSASSQQQQPRHPQPDAINDQVNFACENVDIILPQQTAHPITRTVAAMMPAMMNGRAVVSIDVLDSAVSRLQLQPSTSQQTNLRLKS